MLYFLIAAAAVAGVAAFTDARTGHIPNWLSGGALGAALLLHLIVGWRFSHSWRGGLINVGFSVGGALMCAAIPAFLYLRGAIGGGDVKLFAALGALCQPMAGLEVETYAFIAAALIAPAKLAYQGVLLQTIGRSLAMVTNPFRKAENRKVVPPELMTWFRLGPAIFLGSIITIILHLGDVS